MYGNALCDFQVIMNDNSWNERQTSMMESGCQIPDQYEYRQEEIRWWGEKQRHAYGSYISFFLRDTDSAQGE